LVFKQKEKPPHRGAKKKLLEDTTNSQNLNSSHEKNPYHWMMDDFGDNKQLEKAKRSLLVTLDDISKGLSTLP
jgi:hypothetical protein